MRDLLEDLLATEALDPIEAARRSLRPPALRKRFYAEAGVAEVPEGFAVRLDGRPVRTPARRVLAAPTQTLAEAVAAEWAGQGEAIDPRTMPLTRLANSIIDGVAEARAAVGAEIAKYLASDLLFYRADGPPGLVARQGGHWDPVLTWIREEHGARFVLAEGVMPVAQPEAALAAARALIPDDAWRLGALHAVTTLTGSALLALALLHGRLDADEAWAAAQVDEDWSLEQWGGDEHALERRAFREAELRAAARVLELLGTSLRAGPQGRTRNP